MEQAEGTRRGGRRAARLLAATALLVIWAAWLVMIAFSARLVATHPYDFEAYYTAAEALRFDHAANIYSTLTLLHAARAHGVCVGFTGMPYVYPPLLAIALEPLTLIPCGSAAVLWLLLNAALWAGATLLLADLLARRWHGSHLAAYALVSGLSLCFWQGFAGLFLGQAHILLLFGMALGLWLTERERPWLAGAALAAVAIVKFFPAALILYYLLRGRGRVVVGAALAGALLLVAMALFSSPATLAAALPAAFVSVRGQTTPGQNEALAIVAPYVGPALAALVGIVWLVVSARRRGDDLLGAGWAACAMLLLSPLVWSFYLVWLLPTFIACLAVLGPPTVAWRGGWRSRTLWGALGLLWLVIALPLALDLRPFATLALWAITGALYWRSSTPAGVASLMAQPETVAVAMSES